MITISDEEKKLIHKHFPQVHIRRTTHKYYMEENRQAMDFLRNKTQKYKEVSPDE